MEKLLDGEIIPGKRIGIFELGWSYEELKAHLVEECTVEDRENSVVLIAYCIKFWVNKESNSVTQISVFGDFKGKFMSKIGIGSTLADVQAYIGTWQEKLDVYILPQYPGICFELIDDDDWDELKSPIEFISVY